MAAGAAAAVAAAAAGGLAAAHSTTFGLAFAAPLLLAVYLWFAKVSPRAAFVSMMATLAVIPVYAVPMYKSFYPEPTAVAALVVAIALWRIGARITLTAVDITFAATCGAMLLASQLGPHSLLATASELFLWIPPYLAGRAICQRVGGERTFIFGAVAAGLLAVPFIAYETVSHHNVFFSLARPGTELTKIWDKPAFRPGGLLRSEGAFGHPLSMSLIVGSCAVLTAALALHVKSRRTRIALLAGAAAMVLAQYTSHERTGWFVLIGGVVLVALAGVPSRVRARYVMATILIVVPLAVLAIEATHPRNGQASVARTESTEDRVKLWTHALEPGALGVVGSPETATFNHFANSIRPGQVAIDSGLLQIADIYGIAAFLALLSVVVAVTAAVWSLRGQWLAAIPAVALIDLLAMAVIAFQTQVPIFVWLMVGATAGLCARRRVAQQQADRPGRRSPVAG